MSSLNIKNNNKWESILSNNANNIFLNSPYFKEKNVKDALEQLRLDNVGLKQNIAYLYQEGTLGQGGGTGTTGSIGEIVSSTFKENGSTIYIDKNKQINIEYRINYRKTEYYDITIKISGTNKKITQKIQSNQDYTWNAGIIDEQGTYYVEFSAVNKDFEQLDIFSGNIVIGALEISSTFSEEVVFSPARPISVSYFINSKLGDAITLVYNYGDGEIEVNNITPNVQNKITFGPLPAKIYNFYMYAKTKDKQSNTLYYTIKVANTESVFISIPAYAQTEYVLGNTINLPYVISTLGAESYVVTGKIYDDENNLIDTITTKGEIGTTNILSFNTNSLSLGYYNISLTCVSVDNPDKFSEEAATLRIELIEKENFKIWTSALEGQQTFLGDFNARSTNASDNIWRNNIKNNDISIDLYNTNGYVSGFLPFSNSLTLRGESYGILKYKPFIDTNIVEDFAINFLYKAYNNGDPNACVVSCGQYSVNTGTLSYGFEITANQVNVRTTNNSVTETTGEDTWINCTIVFEKIEDKIKHTGQSYETLYANYFIKIYLDGVLSKSNFVSMDSAYYLTNNIYLGCRANNVANNIQLSNFSHCEIKNIRIYDIRLSEHQVEYNYISDNYWQNPIYDYDTKGNIIGISGYDIQKQRELRTLNSYNDEGEFIFNLSNPATCPLKILKITFYDDETGNQFYLHTRTTSWEGKDFNKKFRCKITFIDKYENIELIDIPGYISLQGTSSGEYLSKNYEIYFGENETVSPAIPYLFTPVESWLPENSFTIKTNMMDSSHANNIGCGQLINNYLYNTKLPCMLSTSVNENPYANKVKYTLEGFPIHMGITFSGSKETYMGVHTFNMGRNSFYNLGLKAFKTLEFVNKNKNVGLVDNYTENTSGIYGQSCAFEINTSNNLGSPAFRQYSDAWMTCFTQRFPIIERPYLSNTKLKSYLQNTVMDIALSTKASGIPQLNLDGTPVLNNKGQIVYLPTDGKDFEDIVEMDRIFANDYLLFAYMLGLSDSLGKNMMLKSWGKEDQNADRIHWYPTFYDMDTCLGVSNDGQLDPLRCGPGMDISSFKDGKFESGENVYIEGEGTETRYVGLGYGTYNLSNSMLWTQFMRYHRFNPGTRLNMNTRYQELRIPKSDGIASFSTSNLFNSFNNVMNQIGCSFYNQDANIKYLQLEEVLDDSGKVIGATYKYVKNFLNGKREAYTKQWITQRIKYCDTIFNLSLVEVPDNTASKNIPMRFNTGTSQVIFPKLLIKTYSPMFPTLYWSGLDINSLISKYLTGDTLNGQSGEGTFVGQVTASNQSSLLTNAPDIEYIKNLKECNPSRLELSEATSLRELDLSGKSSIEYLDVKTCKSLKTLKLNNCINLRGVDGQLNVEGCESLEYLDISNTKIEKLVLSTGDTPKVVLNTFKASNCNITSVNFKGQSYLKTFNMDNCKSLTDLTFDGCTSLPEINCSNYYISDLVVKDCTQLTTLNLSGCTKLINLTISNCPMLTEINLSNCVSPENAAGAKIDLTGAYNLTTIKLNNSNITSVIFNKDLKSIKSVDISNAIISQTSFGNNVSTYLDTNEPLFDLSEQDDLENCIFSRNNNLIHLSFRKLILHNNSNTFEGCNNIVTIQGEIHLKGKIESTFAYCTQLRFNDIIFVNDNITHANMIFQGCNNLTYEQCKNFITITDTTTSYIGTFANNNGITYTGVINNLFATHKNLTYLSSMFSGCRNLIALLNEDFFSTCTNVIKADKMFLSSGIVGINEMILKPLINVDNIDEIFANTGIITTINDGENLFKYNIKLTQLIAVFRGCSKMTINLKGGIDSNKEEIPGEGTALLFKHNKLLTSVNSCFKNVKINGKINSETFKYNPYLIDISYAFSNTGLYGILHSDLFTFVPELKYALGFIQQTNITGQIPNKFFANAPKLVDISEFFNETQINTGAGNINAIEYDIFENNIYLENIYGLFKGCTGLRGQIPNNLFKNLKNLKRFGSLFEGCINLTGNIPYDLFLILDEKPKPSIIPSKLFTSFNAMSHTYNNNIWMSDDNNYEMTLRNFIFDDIFGWHDDALIFNSSDNIIDVPFFTAKQYFNASIVFVINKINLEDNIILFNGNNNITNVNQNTFNANIISNELYLNNILNNNNSANTNIEIGKDIVISFVINATDGLNQIYINGSLASENYIQTGIGDYINESMSIGNSSVNDLFGSSEYNTTGKFKLKKVYFYNNLLSSSENYQIYQAIATTDLLPYEQYIQLNVNQIPSTPSHILSDTKIENNTTNVFKGCTGLTNDMSTDKFGKFFEGMSNTISLNAFFENCTNLKGYLHKNLLKNLKYVKTLDNMFRNCTSLIAYNVTENNDIKYYFVSPEFFKDCVNIESLLGFFSGWNFISFHNTYIPENLFENLTNLSNISYLFYKTYLPKGIPDSLFQNNHNISDISFFAAECDYNSNRLSSRLFLPYSITDKVEIGNKVTNASYAFSNAANLLGEAIEFWDNSYYDLLKSNYVKCYQNCIYLSGYESFPSIAK